MEDRGVDGVRDHDRVAELEPELAMLPERELRLEDRRGRELGIHIRDPRVCPVVEAPIHADRAIDPMHHARAAPSEPLQARDVEVERVEEAGLRLTGDPVQLDLETAAVELAHEGADELVAAARGRGSELVEDREISATAARAQHVELGREATRRGARRLARDSTRSA